MVSVTLDHIKRLVPNAQGEYVAAFSDADRVLARFEIGQDGLRVAHFLAQILAETGGLRVFEENLNYSALRLTQVWPRHFPNLEAAERYAHDPEHLGNFVYGATIHRDLGNTQPGDGYRFRGRGMLQITGRAAYQRYGDQLGVPLVDAPNLAFDHRYSLMIAAAEFTASKHNGRTCNQLADSDDIVGVTIAINGGENGLDARRRWLQRTKAVFVAPVNAAPPPAAFDPAWAQMSSRALANQSRTEFG